MKTQAASDRIGRKDTSLVCTSTSALEREILETGYESVKLGQTFETDNTPATRCPAVAYKRGSAHGQ